MSYKCPICGGDLFEPKEIRVKKVTETAIVPSQGSDGAAGFDLCIDSAEEIRIPPHSAVLVALVARGCEMGTLALKKEIKRLEVELSEAIRKNGNLLSANIKYEDRVKQLNADLLAEKEKYAALLEKYIAMMEKAANLYHPGDEVLTIFDEIGSMLLAWYAANYYDANLNECFERIKKKHTEV